MEPSVSICIPSYNHARYLPQAIESALAQTLRDVEIIVGDNRSTDGTAQLVEPFAKRDGRLRYITTPEHLPMHESFNFVMRAARGRYIKLLCADDVLEPQCVQRLRESLESSADIVLAACARRFFSQDGVDEVRQYASRAVVCAGEEAIRQCYFRGNLIGEPSAVMFRRADLGEGFTSRFAQLVDLHLWFRLLEKGRFAFVPAPLCRIRLHSGQATERNLSSGTVTADREKLFADFAAKPYLRGTFGERLLWDLRMACAVHREHASGRPLARPGAVYFPGLAGPLGLAGRALWRFSRPA